MTVETVRPACSLLSGLGVDGVRRTLSDTLALAGRFETPRVVAPLMTLSIFVLQVSSAALSRTDSKCASGRLIREGAFSPCRTWSKEGLKPMFARCLLGQTIPGKEDLRTEAGYYDLLGIFVSPPTETGARHPWQSRRFKTLQRQPGSFHSRKAGRHCIIFRACMPNSDLNPRPKHTT
jgi:hypothetical protein